jgi:FG-GAP-like repeat
MASRPSAVAMDPAPAGRATILIVLLAATAGAQEPLFPVRSFDAGDYLRGVVLFDLDGDGALDAVTWSHQDVVNVVLGNGDGTFDPLIMLPTSEHVLTAAVGDLDTDGVPDLVCQNSTAQTVSVFKGLGGGSFASAQPWSAGGQPEDVLLVDMDEDGDLDALVPDFDGAATFLAGNGSGGFLPPASVPLPAGPVGIDAGDLDLDGHLDAVVATVFSNLVMTLLGDGHGGLTVSASYPTGPTTRDIALADIDANGLLDVVTIRYGGGLSLLLGTSPGVHAPAPDLALVPCGDIEYQSAESVDVHDIDANGTLDVLAASGECGELQVFAGDGQGGFAPPVVHVVGGDCNGFDVGDVDGDGDRDVAAAGSASSLSVLRGDGAGGLLSNIRIDLPGSSGAIATADLDSDGAEDVVSARVYGSGLIVLAGTAEGGLGPPVLLPFPEDGMSVGLALADLDGDGDEDAVVSDYPGDQVFVALGDGNGAFTVHGAIAVGGPPYGMTTADFDENGWMDAAFVQYGASEIRVLFGDGAGGWSASATEAVGDDPADVVAADLDADGHADLVASNFGSDSVNLLFGDGLGGFGAAAPLPTGDQPDDVEPADADDDGDLDLLIAQAGSSAKPGSVGLLRGDGTGSFAPVETLEVGLLDVVAVKLADLDGDGVSDLIASGGAILAVRFGTGTGTFAPAIHFACAGGSELAVLDVDRDGALDVVGTTYYSTSLGVLLNRTPTPWQALPGGLAGGLGVPVLTGTGELLAGTPMTLALTGALPASAVHLVAGIEATNVPFKSGVLVPSADLIVPWLLTGPAGSLTLQALWPSGVPSGWTLYLQEWVHDAGAPKGFAATNGLAATVP